MPKVSKESATLVDDFGVAEDRYEDLDGYTVNFVSIRETHDLAPMLKALPGGNCSCPHSGYVVKGRITVRYDDHEEVIEAGDAFAMPPGSRPGGGGRYPVCPISPANDMAATQEAIKKALQ
jgi:hypothetical protein